jgi:hypothetical protein
MINASGDFRTCSVAWRRGLSVEGLQNLLENRGWWQTRVGNGSYNGSSRVGVCARGLQSRPRRREAYAWQAVASDCNGTLSLSNLVADTRRERKCLHHCGCEPNRSHTCYSAVAQLRRSCATTQQLSYTRKDVARAQLAWRRVQSLTALNPNTPTRHDSWIKSFGKMRVDVHVSISMLNIDASRCLI